MILYVGHSCLLVLTCLSLICLPSRSATSVSVCHLTSALVWCFLCWIKAHRFCAAHWCFYNCPDVIGQIGVLCNVVRSFWIWVLAQGCGGPHCPYKQEEMFSSFLPLFSPLFNSAFFIVCMLCIFHVLSLTLPLAMPIIYELISDNFKCVINLRKMQTPKEWGGSQSNKRFIIMKPPPKTFQLNCSSLCKYKFYLILVHWGYDLG